MITKEQEDIILIQNILDGNLTAQETLYKRYRKIIKDFILSKQKIYFDIDDDVSEVLIKVFMNIKDFNEHKSKFKSWVLTITKNYMIDKWRCTATCCTTILPASNNLLLATGSISNTTFTTNNSNLTSFNNSCSYSTSCNFENSNAVNYISSQLSPVDFTLIDMKYVQGYDYMEIGSEFQLTSSTVSNKINYIKTKLKKSLRDDIFD